MNKAISYDSLCEEYQGLAEKTHKALIELLNKRGIESINVKEYMNEDVIDYFTFPQSDKNGYGVNARIATIRKGKVIEEKEGWVADLEDEDADEFNTLDITTYNFGASELIDIYGIVEEIFDVADTDYDGRVLSANETFEDIDGE